MPGRQTAGPRLVPSVDNTAPSYHYGRSHPLTLAVIPAISAGFWTGLPIRSSSRLPRLRTFDSFLRFPDFRLLWCANFCANTGTWLQLLSVGWLVKDLSVDSQISGLLVVGVGAINTLPSLLVNPLTGVLGDRLDRRKLMMTVQAMAAALALGFAFLVDSEYIRAWHAYAYVLISGAFLAVSQPMQQVLVANSVPREAVSNAYALNVLTITGTRIFGPFIGGLLIFWLGYFWNFALESALYLSVVLFLVSMRVRYSTAHAEGPKRKFTPIADFRDGILYLWRQQREIFQMMVVSVIPNTVLHPVWFLLPLFTAEVLRANVDMGGYLLAVTGIGGFISTLAIATLGLPRRRGYVLLVTAAFSSACTMALAYSSWLPAAFFFLAVPLPVPLPHYPGHRGAHPRPRPVPRPHLRSAGLRARFPHRCQRPRRYAGRRHLWCSPSSPTSTAPAPSQCWPTSAVSSPLPASSSVCWQTPPLPPWPSWPLAPSALPSPPSAPYPCGRSAPWHKEKSPVRLRTP